MHKRARGERYDLPRQGGCRSAARRELDRYRGEHPIVMALPRGGVPVGFEVARSLEAPLDVLANAKEIVTGSRRSKGATVSTLRGGLQRSM